MCALQVVPDTTMPPSEQSNLLEKLERTRRNFLAMASIVAGAALSGCKADNDLNQRIEEIAAASNKPHHSHSSQRPNCFLRGTRILTPTGEKNVEHLVVGELVSTADGHTTTVKWIGKRCYPRLQRHSYRSGVEPIRIARGSLRTAVPHSDLFVSSDHRFYVDGVLIRAADLVDGRSVTIDDRHQDTDLEYLHILTERHSLVFSEGMASETLLFDPKKIRLFDNFAEYEALYGTPVGEPERPCAPVYADLGRRARLGSHLRNALSPWFDKRDQLDIVRDRLLAGTLLCKLSA